MFNTCWLPLSASLPRATKDTLKLRRQQWQKEPATPHPPGRRFAGGGVGPPGTVGLERKRAAEGGPGVWGGGAEVQGMGFLYVVHVTRTSPWKGAWVSQWTV